MKLFKHIIIAIALIFFLQESKAQCDASFTYSSGSLTVNFISGFSGVMPSFNWNFGDGNTGTGMSINHTYASPGIYQVRLIKIKTGCVDTAIFHVAVEASPCTVTAGIGYDGTNSFNQQYDFIGTGSNSTTTYLWYFGDGNTDTAKNPFHRYTKPDYYHISLIATDTNGCSSSDGLSNRSCILADFQDSAFGLSHYLTSTSLGTSSTTTYNWDFGDGNTDTVPNPVHTYASAGNYRITLMVFENLCFDSISKVITSSGCAITASFTESSVGLTTTFTSTSTGTSASTNYSWFFGDGNSSNSQNPIHTYATAGTYNVTLLIEDTLGGYCADTLVSSITVAACNLNASFVETISGLTVGFNSTSTGIYGTATYYWDFGDGSTSTSITPSHTYSSAGVYTASLTLSDSVCSDSNSRLIGVSANVMTPNGDGIDDVFPLPCSGGAATVYNSTGILVKNLASGSPSWDGTNNLGGNEPTGLYFVICAGSSTPVSVTLIR